MFCFSSFQSDAAWIVRKHASGGMDLGDGKTGYKNVVHKEGILIETISCTSPGYNLCPEPSSSTAQNIENDIEQSIINGQCKGQGTYGHITYTWTAGVVLENNDVEYEYEIVDPTE